MKINKNTYQQGLSLIEVLTAFAIFGSLSIALMAIFTNSVNTQTIILQNQAIMNETNYVLDYMGRVIRLAKYDGDGNCVSVGNNYDLGTNSIRFLSWSPTDGPLNEGGYVCREFSLENNKIAERLSSDEYSSNFGNWIDLTSSQVKVESLTFNVTGNARSDTVQPKVTINFGMIPSGRRIEPVPEIIIQTSLSQRNLDLDSP